MDTDPSIKPTDLRGILKYVPMFRGQTFVISVDGSVVEHEGFRNLLMDLAVFRSLNIRIILVHGVGQQIRSLAAERGAPVGDPYGSEPTDERTLGLAVEASGRVSSRILAQFTELGVRCATANAVRATEKGIIRGTDYRLTGRVDKVDAAFLGSLLADGITPLVSPVVATRTGRILRVNSDLIAAELASSLEASKLIFLTSHPGLSLRGEVLLNVPADELRETLAREPEAIQPGLLSKVECSLMALGRGTPRAHILDGRVFGALLTEVFDKVGLGTMIHSNDYDRIRPATPADARALHNLIRNASAGDAVRERSLAAVEEGIADFHLYEIDGSLVACAALLPYPEDGSAELACVFVQPFHQGRGVGLKMVRYAEREARARGFRRLFALSTQSFAFFSEVCGFAETDAGSLPPARREILEREGRRSRILVKDLDPAPTGHH
ncbi:MAG: amino-acid N-acetyltransferase [Puniceicoccaceae bacterium]